MRIVRLLGVVLSILVAGLLLATPAGAQPPDKLTDHVTDGPKVLTDSGRAAVTSAIDRLSRDQHIQLWVVYVDNFNRFKPENWAERTRSASGMGDHDVLLAVATNTKLYTFNVPPQVQGLTAGELNSLQSNKIEPAVNEKDWVRAAVAAADGLNKPPNPSANPTANAPKRNWLPIAIGVGVVVVVVLIVFLLYRRSRARVHAGGHGAIDGRDLSLGQALSTADDRMRQISDYVTKYRQGIGAEAQHRFDEAKRHLAAAHSKQTSNEQDAIAHANAASTLAAQAQSMANADVLAAHRTPRRGGSASGR